MWSCQYNYLILCLRIIIHSDNVKRMQVLAIHRNFNVMANISNIVNRNISLMLAVAFFIGFAFCLYEAFHGRAQWLNVLIVAIVDACFVRLYFHYRKGAKNGG